MLEALGDEADPVPVTLWPGRMPSAPLPAHPALAPRIGTGSGPHGPLWVEARPAGPLLRELGGRLPPEALHALVSSLAAGLAALHRVGQSHGSVGPGRVRVRPDCTGVLVGSGVDPGTQQGDLRGLLGLLGVHAPQTDDLAQLHAALSTCVPDPGQPVLLPRALIPPSPPPPATPEVWTVQIETPSLGVDEVVPDLGPERGQRGLLDGWTGGGWTTNSGVTGTQGRSSTSPEIEPLAELDTSRDLRGTAVLAMLAAGMFREVPPGRFAASEGTPSKRIKGLIADEPLDPIPVPDGVPLGGGGWQSLPSASPPGEVTATQGAPVTATEHAPSATEFTEDYPRPSEVTFPTVTGESGPGRPTFVALAITVGLALGLGTLALLFLSGVVRL